MKTKNINHIFLKIICLCCLILFIHSGFIQAQHNNELTVRGDLYIQGGATLYVQGDVEINTANADLQNGGTIEVQGNWTFDGMGAYEGDPTTPTVNANERIVIFRNDDVNTAEDQYISGPMTGNNAFYNVEVDNTGNNELLYLNDNDAEVAGTLTFTTGRLRTDDGTNEGSDGSMYAHKLVVSNVDPAAIVNNITDYDGSDTRYVEGQLERAIDAAGGTYDFPLGTIPGTGNGEGLQFANFNFGTNDYNSVLGYFKHNDPITTSPTLIACQVSNTCEYGTTHGQWNMIPNNMGTGNYDINVFPQHFGDPGCGGIIDEFYLQKDNDVPTSDCYTQVDPLTGMLRSGLTDMDGSKFGVGAGGCLAEAGVVVLTEEVVCPGDDLRVTIVGYENLMIYSTSFILTDVNGEILDVIDLDANNLSANYSTISPATDANSGTSPSFGGSTITYTIDYDYWGLVAGDAGIDLLIYAYNVLDVGQPTPSPVIGENIANIASQSGGCYDVSDSFSIFVPAPFNIEVDINASEGIGGTSVFSYNNHQIEFSGGTGPYNYKWETDGYVRHAVVGEGDLSILYADNAQWSVTVTDANGCTSDLLAFTNLPDSGTTIGGILDIIDYQITPEVYSGKNGAVDITVTGGTPAYKYEWSGPNGFSATTEDIFSLATGWYSVTVTDSGDPQQNTVGWYWVPNIDENNSDGGIRGKVKTNTRLYVYPNPFTDEATIDLFIAQGGQTNITLYALDGRKIQNVFDGITKEGESLQIPLAANDLVAGVYMLRMNTENGEVRTAKVIVSK